MPTFEDAERELRKVGERSAAELAMAHACACAVCPHCAAGCYPLLAPRGDDGYRHDMKSLSPGANAPVLCKASAIHRLIGTEVGAEQPGWMGSREPVTEADFGELRDSQIRPEGMPPEITGPTGV